MGMDAGGKSHRRPSRPHRVGPCELDFVFRAEDAERGVDVRVARPRYDGVEIRSEFLASDMAVTVD